jgi:hypothetical protein
MSPLVTLVHIEEIQRDVAAKQCLQSQDVEHVEHLLWEHVRRLSHLFQAKQLLKVGVNQVCGR